MARVWAEQWLWSVMSWSWPRLMIHVSSYRVRQVFDIVMARKVWCCWVNVNIHYPSLFSLFVSWVSIILKRFKLEDFCPFKSINISNFASKHGSRFLQSAVSQLCLSRVSGWAEGASSQRDSTSVSCPVGIFLSRAPWRCETRRPIQWLSGYTVLSLNRTQLYNVIGCPKVK